MMSEDGARVARPEVAAGPTSPRSYAVGIIHYQTYRDLEACLDSVHAQSVRPKAVWVIDADGDPARLAPLEAAHAGVAFEPAPNRGYAAAANRILARAAQEQPEIGFCLLLNPDVVLDAGFGERLMDALIAHPAAALGTGKLLRPDGITLDSAGIALPHHRRPRDRGSEEKDRGQYDRGEYVFGASGAALMVRSAALADLALEGEIFDEDFFLYHEDTDLSWRSHVLGWRVYYEPRARALHARGWQREGRFRVPASVRRHSFKNHYLQLIKNESLAGLLLRLPLLLGWELLRLGHALVRDRAVLAGYADALRLSGRALHKRRLLRARRVQPRGPPP
jgi:GT2 family glycosyltransferase